MGDVLIELDMHQAVVSHGVHSAGSGGSGFKALKRLGYRYLIDHDLSLDQRVFRNSVPGLDQSGRFSILGRHDASCFLEKLANVHGVDRVITPLIDHFKGIVLPNDGGSDLNAACSPTVWQGHFLGGKWHLIAWDGDGLQKRASNHALGLFVQVGKIKTRVVARFLSVIHVFFPPRFFLSDAPVPVRTESQHNGAV